MLSYQGFDPLQITSDYQSQSQYISIFKNATKKSLLNIMKCYTGYFDIFSELIQNALDATEKQQRIAGASYTPRIRIDIDLKNRAITVSDNGTGMTKEQFEFCLAPNISFKTTDNLRGNKGVGATFLAYGYNRLQIFTKASSFEASVYLDGGRDWLDNSDVNATRPVFRDLSNHINDFLDSESHGTIFRISLRTGEKPNLGYLSASTPEQWAQILRIRTPLGGVHLTGDLQYRPSISIVVVNYDGNMRQYTMEGAEYYYPHEIPNIKVEDVFDIEKAVKRIPGDTEEKFRHLPEKYKNLTGIYGIWDSKEIINNQYLCRGLSEEQIQLIQRNSIIVYGFFCNSTQVFNKFNDDILKIRHSYRILRGGLQLASDGMVQGDLISIPLTKRIGYQNQSHIIVHFTDGQPDLGRKTFQPDKTEVALQLSTNAVQYLIRYRRYIKSDETANPLLPDKDRHDWIREQEEYERTNPLLIENIPNISIKTKPQKEQDVIALFHELLGNKVLKVYEILSTSEHQR